MHMLKFSMPRMQRNWALWVYCVGWKVVRNQMYMLNVEQLASELVSLRDLF